jgi:uncharacterized protein
MHHDQAFMISRRHFLRFFAGLGAVSVSTAAYGFGEPVFRLRVAHYDISPPQWPADLELKIAVIADLHACDPWMSLQHIEAIVERTNALNADIIVMLGDYVAGHRHITRIIPAGEWAPVLAGLKAPLGVHAILGNHDWWSDNAVQQQGRGPTIARRALEAAGIPVYENDARRLSKAGRPFWLAGLGDQLAYFPARRFRPVSRVGVDDLAATLAKVTDDAPVVLLAHEPDVAVRVPARVALQLSGLPMAARCACSAGPRLCRRATAEDSPTATPGPTATSSCPVVSVAASCRSASAFRPRSCW